jgi:hypothetical protein
VRDSHLEGHAVVVVASPLTPRPAPVHAGGHGRVRERFRVRLDVLELGRRRGRHAVQALLERAQESLEAGVGRDARSRAGRINEVYIASVPKLGTFVRHFKED